MLNGLVRPAEATILAGHRTEAAATGVLVRRLRPAEGLHDNMAAFIAEVAEGSACAAESPWQDSNPDTRATFCFSANDDRD